MNATTYGWIVLGSPLAGTLLLALGWKRLPGRDGRLARQRGDRRLVPGRGRRCSSR